MATREDQGLRSLRLRVVSRTGRQLWRVNATDTVPLLKPIFAPTFAQTPPSTKALCVESPTA